MNGSSGGENFTGEASNTGRVAVLDLRGALGALALGGFLLHFGVGHAIEAGSHLRRLGWRPGQPLPAWVPFAHAPGSAPAEAASSTANATLSAGHLPADQALGIVLFCLAMGGFLCLAGLRAAVRRPTHGGDAAR